MHYPTRYPVMPFRGPGLRGRPQFGDMSSIITSLSNIGAQVNSLVTGSPTSTVYTPTSVPLSASSLSSFSGLLPYAIGGAILYMLLRKKSA